MTKCVFTPFRQWHPARLYFCLWQTSRVNDSQPFWMTDCLKKTSFDWIKLESVKETLSHVIKKCDSSRQNHFTRFTLPALKGKTIEGEKVWNFKRCVKCSNDICVAAWSLRLSMTLWSFTIRVAQSQRVVCRRKTLISHNYCQFKQSTVQITGHR